MTTYYKTISESEAYYSIKEGELVKSGGGQSSYNLPKKFFRYVTENEILIQELNFPHARRNMDGNAFILNKDYEFRLGPSVLRLIGEGYGNVDNQFIASMNGTNGKFQIYRKVYDELGWRFGWFVELYDKNLSGNELILDIDENNKVFTLDIEFTINITEYLEYIRRPHLRI